MIIPNTGQIIEPFDNNSTTFKNASNYSPIDIKGRNDSKESKNMSIPDSSSINRTVDSVY